MLVSIVVRTYNEARYLADLLQAIESQVTPGFEAEVVLVDSGSTDRTLDIAATHGARIVSIDKASFSFGRSLNIGCRAAEGDVLVFVSGHCIPSTKDWLANLVSPLNDEVAYVYGRQLGVETSKFSEVQLFRKYFPEASSHPQEGFFCNNANAALLRSVWERFGFDEALTGLEDMELGKRLVAAGLKLGYVAEAPVYHCHHENWATIKRRYEREAIALQYIMPEIHVTLRDFVRYFVSAVALDSTMALKAGELLRRWPEIVMFRLMQFWGAYRGNHEHRKLSSHKKELYYYPR